MSEDWEVPTFAMPRVYARCYSDGIVTAEVVEPFGRAVRTKLWIKAGDLIFRDPVHVWPVGLEPLLEQCGYFQMHVFESPDGRMFFPMGWTALMAHDAKPNCVLTFRPDEHLIDVTACRDIEAEELLTHDYNVNAETPWYRKPGPSGT